VAAGYILAALSIVFFAAAGIRIAKGQPMSHPQVRTWLMVGGIFALVGAWLTSRVP
jgi:hypothetical protein